MADKLTVNYFNMCLFVLTDFGAEAWFIEDEHHRPILDFRQSQIDVPADVLEQFPEGFELTGWRVFFTDGDSELDDEPTALGGFHISHLAHMAQVAPGAKLEAGWDPYNNSVPPGMTSRIRMNGGTLSPRPLDTKGGAKIWRIGENLTQRLTHDTGWERLGIKTPVIHLVEMNGTGTHSWPLRRNDSGDFFVSIVSKERDEPKVLDHLHGVVFIEEFDAFDKPVKLEGSAELPVPHTFWPDYTDETDPNGGPCPHGVIDRRTVRGRFL
jgi:hypothetical protein